MKQEQKLQFLIQRKRITGGKTDENRNLNHQSNFRNYLNNQPMKYNTTSILKCFELYSVASDLAADWFLKISKLQDEDKEIAKLYYKKADKERTVLAKRLEGMTSQWA